MTDRRRPEALQDRMKREFLAEWVDAVNERGGFGRWASAVSFKPADVADVLVRRGAAPA